MVLFSAIFTLGLMATVWLWPLFFISVSERTTRREKWAWSVAVVFFSWFAFIIYLIYISMKKDDDDWIY